jgi:hypothetical protein
LANANAGTPLNPNLTTQQLWNEFYQIITQPKSDIESIIANQLMKFLYAPPAPGGVGANGQVIFNDGGVLAGDPQFLWNKTTNLLTVTGSATITGDLTVDTNVLKVDTSNNRVGINTASPTVALEVAGSATITGNLTVDSNTLVVTASTDTVCIGATTTDAKFRILDASGNGVRIGFSPGVLNYNLYDATVHEFRAVGGTNSFGAITANGIGLGVTPAASGIGVAFPATQSASSNANTLDDYEEGTFTPTVTSEFGTIGTTTVNSANYTKIGRLVSVNFDISIITAGTGTGGLLVSVPFNIGEEACGAGRETSNTGNMCQVFRQSATAAGVRFYNNLTPIANLNRFFCTYTYSV